MPAPPGADNSLFGVKDGLLGYYIRRSDARDGYEITRVDGKTWTGSMRPDQLIDWPGKSSPLALTISGAWRNSVSDEISLWDDAGQKTGAFGDDEWPMAGFTILPRESWLHYLEPRDLASSIALRNVTDEALAKVLDVAIDDDDDKLAKTIAAVKTFIPGVTNDVIRGGVARVARAAAERQAELTAILDRGTGGGGTLTDDAVQKAVPSLEADGYEDGFAATDMKLVANAFLDGTRGKLTSSRIQWEKSVETLAKLACFFASRGSRDEVTRKTLVDLLDALRDSRLFGMTVTRAALKVKTGSPFLARPKGKNVWFANEGDEVYFARIDEDEDEPEQPVSVLVRGNALKLPADATLISQETVDIPDDTAFVTTFLKELESRGPAPHDATAAALVTGETSLTAAEVVLLLAGVPGLDRRWGPHDFLGKELREKLGLKVTDASRAKDKLFALPNEHRAALVSAAASVNAPSDYWARADAPGSSARGLIAKAKALFGKNVVLREELVLAIEKELSLDLPVRKALAVLLAPSEPSSYLTPRKEPAAWDDIGQSGEFFSGSAVTTFARLIPYVALELPVGDDYRAHIRELHTTLTKLLDNPDVLLPMGGRSEENAAKRALILDQIGGAKVAVAKKRDGEARDGRDNGFVRAVDDGWGEIEIAVRTSKIRTDRQNILPYLTQSRAEENYGVEAAAAAFYLFSKDCDALVARIADSPVPAGSYEANPLLSAKSTVKKLAGAAGVDEEAAALYLQMLALPNPTKKLVMKLNAWKPAQYDKAAQALVKKKLCIEGKRERAGRDIFLPGSWEKNSRGLSMETYKQSLYDRVSFDEPIVSVPFHALYEKVLARWSSGDKPGFVDVTKKKK